MSALFHCDFSFVAILSLLEAELPRLCHNRVPYFMCSGRKVLDLLLGIIPYTEMAHYI